MVKKSAITSYLALSTFVLAALYWAYHRVNPLVFNPVNGDFQTFNPIYRLLDGQLPFHDFSNYLGAGPLFMTFLATLPTGGSFAGSVFSTDILVSVAFLYMATTAFRLLGTPRPWMFAIALYLLGRLPLFLELLPPSQFTQAASFLFKTITSYLGLKFLVAPGHSLMPIRVLWPFLAAVPFMYYLRAPSTYRVAVLGGVLGAGLFWSNDYGPSTALAFGLLAIIAVRNIRHIGVAILTSLCAAALVVTLITGGHPMDWLTFNQAVSQDQFWYYYFPDKKIISFDTLELDEATWILMIILMSGGVFFKWAKCKPTPEMLTFFGIFLTTLFASLLSIFGSAWYPYYLSAPIFICVVGMIHHYAPAIGKRINSDGVLVMGGFGVLSILLLTGLILHPTYSPANADEAKLGAKLHGKYDGFPEMMKLVRTADGNVWSTYSTAVEAVLGVHHPSGQDYIIHALGDSGRAKYLNAFHEKNPRLVITPRPDKILWEVWSRIINWWFYRELLRDYVPVGQGPYWTVWERNTPQVLLVVNLACVMHQVAPGSVQIRIQGGKDLAGHVADVRLTYHAESPAFTRLLLELEDTSLRSQYIKAVKKENLDVKTFNPQSSVGFPPKAGAWNIPVVLDENGTGVSTVHANRRSAMGATLEVTSCIAKDWAPDGRIDR